MFFLVIFLVVVSLAKHRDPLQSLLFAVALAVGSDPGIPSYDRLRDPLQGREGSWREKKVIVKHLSAIQNFGSIDVLCSDKTGTLTSGNMKLDRSLDPFGEPSQASIDSGVSATASSKRAFEVRSTWPFCKTPEPEEAAGYEKRDEIPYDFERRRLSIVVERQSRRLLITKGAPEGILALSVTMNRTARTAPFGCGRARSLPERLTKN